MTAEGPDVYVGTALERAASAIGAAGYQAYSNCIVGNQAAAVRRYFDRVRNPAPGDLVVETSTFYSRDRRGYGHVAVGTLVCRADEHIAVPPNVDEPEGWEYDEEAWYVIPLAGGETIRWTNADFIAIPATYQQGIDWGRP